MVKDCVFYSRHCQHSQRLIELLKDAPFAKQFAYISVDADPQTKKRNTAIIHVLEVDKVPTMYIGGRKLVGKDAFLWVQSAYEQSVNPPRQPPTSPQTQLAKVDEAIDMGFRNRIPIGASAQQTGQDDQENEGFSFRAMNDTGDGAPLGAFGRSASSDDDKIPTAPRKEKITKGELLDAQVKQLAAQRKAEMDNMLNLPHST